jgi:uncharacterized protein (UPF0333 family)
MENLTSSHNNTNLKKLIGQNKGQLIVEYILLIFIVVVIASLLTKSLVGRGTGNSGIVINAWSRMVEMVASDLGD